MSRRVVVTGLGAIAPNGNGIGEFELALRKGRSGIRAIPKLEELGFGCRVAGVPQGVDELASATFREDELLAMNANHRFAALAAVEAWTDAGLARPAPDGSEPDWASGAVIGTGIGGMDTIGEKVVPLTDAGKVRRLGSTAVEQVMASGPSARVGGILALGNQVTTNSSACSTGAEAVQIGFERIRAGLAERMVCGGSEGASHYIWAGFDAMRVLSRIHPEAPERASRPLSASAAGFVPGSGAGALVLESLESAEARGARVYAELLAAHVNCGGQRGGGSMTAPNPAGVVRCIRGALAMAGLAGRDVDLVNGHLTATGADPREVRAWSEALERGPDAFPWITATKSMIGHALGAAGAIEAVATVLMLARRFVHPCLNAEDLHPEIAPFARAIPLEAREAPELKIAAKAAFGFGDVNSCLLFRRWDA
ncbi:MAG TPA: beta-ketoacyl-[acyl-carrier-protein] synthase family protein [Myxococcota bacterium]|jgi:3-oxoacyl-(acyl-carrier-protein) synthase|nr:beta-ketoacyl-[acyl-carrier-protein] synthase family protein [Myxococcota bacterium]